MSREETYRPEPPEFTVLHMVTMVVSVCVLAGIIGWILMNKPALPSCYIHLISLLYLRYRLKATEQAIGISCVPVGAVTGLFVAAENIFNTLTQAKPAGLEIAIGAVLCASSIAILRDLVGRLPKGWQTPVRHIYV